MVSRYLMFFIPIKNGERLVKVCWDCGIRDYHKDFPRGFIPPVIVDGKLRVRVMYKFTYCD